MLLYFYRGSHLVITRGLSVRGVLSVFIFHTIINIHSFIHSNDRLFRNCKRHGRNNSWPILIYYPRARERG
jgi:hypothetical protein